MSGNPTTQPTNVVPMPTNWPGPMFPGSRPWPQSPSCFSELASLNACYDSVQMMNQILAKVMTDLVTNDPAVQKAIVEAIAASGSNVPLIGVTNGTDAQPGQVGEYVQFTTNVTFPAATLNTQQVSIGILQPGDWDVWTSFTVNSGVDGIEWWLAPQPAGFSTQMAGGVINIDGNYGPIVGEAARALISVPTLMNFQLSTNVLNNAGSGGNAGQFITGCRRRR